MHPALGKYLTPDRYVYDGTPNMTKAKLNLVSSQEKEKH